MTWPFVNTPYIWPMVGAAAFLAALAVYGWCRRLVPGAFPFALPFALLMAFAAIWAAGAALELASADGVAKHWWFQFGLIFQLPVATASLWFALEYANLSRWLTRSTLALLAVAPVGTALLILTNPLHHWLTFGFPAPRSLPPAPALAVKILIVYGLLLAVALFRFRLFDLIPMARGTAIEQMREGMLMVDTQRRIVDLNPAAARILGEAAPRARGANLDEIFPACPAGQSEIVLDRDGEARRYALYQSAVEDWRGMPLGSLILLHDVTGERRAQAALIEERSALATLRERDRVARELHDSLGQVLGFVKMQAHSAWKLLEQGKTQEAGECLTKLAAVAQEAHSDVREYIAGAMIETPGAAFLPTVDAYLRRFSESCGIAVQLETTPEMSHAAIEPTVQAQLLRMIQQALTNTRKHARAHSVHVRLTALDGHVEAIVEDDGAGFDPALLESNGGHSFGMRFMRERAESVGGTVRVDSAPGEGTRVVISAPLGRSVS